MQLLLNTIMLEPNRWARARGLSRPWVDLPLVTAISFCSTGAGTAAIDSLESIHFRMDTPTAPNHRGGLRAETSSSRCFRIRPVIRLLKGNRP